MVNPSIKYKFSRDSPPLSSDFRVKIEGSTCQNVNNKVPLDCLEKNLSFLWSYWYVTVVSNL